jgi:hypothetical protein
MKMKNVFYCLAVLAFTLGACGPEPEPTMSAADVQGTAVAAAWTMVAETQAAIPTDTPIPPTETASPTPLPTNTLPPLDLPTQSAFASPTTASNKDECDQFLPGDAAGPTAPLKIYNETKAPLNLSLYLEKTPFGMCGYRGYSIPANNSILINFPQGVMYAYAWILEPLNTTVSGGPWKPNNTDKWSIFIKESSMKMVGP